MSVVAVFNQKGGVGKTTSTLNIAAALRVRRGAATVVDLDPQAHLTLALGVRNLGPEDSIHAFFAGRKSLAEIRRPHPSGLEVIPASSDLSNIEATHGGDPAIARRLAEGIARLDERGPMLLDCSPALGVLSLNALVAAAAVLLPVSADYLSLEGANRLSGALDVLEGRLGKRFVRRIVLTRFDARRRLAYDIHAMLRERFGAIVCDTVIKENVSLAESPMYGQDIFSFAAGSQGAADYRALTEELERGNFFDAEVPGSTGTRKGGVQ